MYKIQNAFHSHTSIDHPAVMENENEKYYSYLLTGWHGQWSKILLLLKNIKVIFKVF